MKSLFSGMLSLLLLLGGINFGVLAAERKYPSKPITMIIAQEAGSGTDIMFRKTIPKAEAILGQPIMVINKPGAGGSIALREIHDVKPDGYTIGGIAAMVITNRLQGILPYDHTAFTIIGNVYSSYPWMIASTKTKRPFKTIEEVLSRAKAEPGNVTMATSGVGYIWWIASMAFQQKAGLKFNIIPQPASTAMTTTQVAGGHCDIGITSMTPARSMIESGLIKLLAFFGPKRSQSFPDVPSINEYGYDVGVSAFGVIGGPRNLPKEVIQKLDEAFGTAVNDPVYQKFAISNDYIPTYMHPNEVTRNLDNQKKIFRTIMEEAGILKEK
jgi:tripartite-type tricarboxylate transporter receptor subunit TctC